MSKDLSDFLAIINLNNQRRNSFFKAKFTKMRLKVLKILLKLGYLHNYQIIKSNKLIITLKYINNRKALRGIKLISKTATQIYVKHKEWKKYRNYLINIKKNGFFICSTDLGLVTDIEMQLLNKGGLVLFRVW